MWFFMLITYLAFLVQVSFATVAIAAGLYYVAELVEEYTVISRKIIWWLNTITLTIFVSLWLFEDFPKSVVVGGILAQISHYVILKDFPYVGFLSPAFLTAIAFILVNHYLAFQHFANVYYSFSEVMAYFTLCLWLVPFALFVSLSANENVLPTTSDRTGMKVISDADVVSNYFSKRNKKYGLLTLFNYAKESILPQRTKKGF